jgi:single-strand DNA-binding protein
MSGVNKVIILGRLGKDPEIKYTPTGTAVANFGVATSQQWKDQDSGEKKEKTEWHSIVAWRKQAELIGEYFGKGDQIYLEGHLETRSWEPEDGSGKRYRTEIIMDTFAFVGSKNGGGGVSRREEPENTFQGKPVPFGMPVGPGDDDIPF